MVNPVLLSGAVIFSSLLVLLSVGLTLTYLTTKVPNFAHGTFAAVGGYVTLTVVNLWKGNPYHYLWLAFLTVGLVALTQYLLVLRPLMNRGASIVTLMIATLAIEFILLAGLNIYADYLSKMFKIKSRYFVLRAADIEIAGGRGLLFIAPIIASIIVLSLYILLTKTKFGIAMRAAIEDPYLASAMGINVNMVYSISWFIAGGLAGISGALLPLHSLCNPDAGAIWIVSTFASSVIGGLLNLYGAVLGGCIIGFAEVLGTGFIGSWLGSWAISYRPLIPLIAISITLLLAPQGITSINWRNVAKRIRRLFSRS